MGRQCDLSRCVNIVSANIAGATDEGLIAHIGLNGTRVDRVNADTVALASELERGLFGKQDNPPFRHRIERVKLRAHKAGNRSEIHDSAPTRARLAAFPRRSHREFRPEKNAGEVYGTEAVPFIQACLFNALSEEHAGIVHEDIEPAPSRDSSADRTVPVFFADNVEAVKDCGVTAADLEQFLARNIRASGT